MTVKFSISKGKDTFKEGMFKKSEVDMYNLSALFTPNEVEKTIYKDHPLFHDFIFMKYNEVDKFTTGIIFTKDDSVDRNKVIKVSDIFNSSNYQFKAYSVERITELRSIILEAGQRFAKNIEVLSALEGTEEIEFSPKIDI